MTMFLSLTKGQVGLIDDEDFERFGAFKWYAQYSPTTKSYYVARREAQNGSGKNGKFVYLHRAIMNCPVGFQVDHINHNPLDNRKQNLRVCTQSQNLMNQKGAHRNSKSQIMGVRWVDARKKWQAHMAFNKKRILSSFFKTKEEAVAMRLNFKEKYLKEELNNGKFI